MPVQRPVFVSGQVNHPHPSISSLLFLHSVYILSQPCKHAIPKERFSIFQASERPFGPTPRSSPECVELSGFNSSRGGGPGSRKKRVDCSSGNCVSTPHAGNSPLSLAT